jgi:hypothetical protein
MSIQHEWLARVLEYRWNISNRFCSFHLLTVHLQMATLYFHQTIGTQSDVKLKVKKGSQRK